MYKIDGISYEISLKDGGAIIAAIDVKGRKNIDLVIPKEIGGKQVVGLARAIFSDDDCFSSVDEFGECYVFNSVTLQENIKELYPETFLSASVKVVNLGSGISEIPAKCFAYSSVVNVNYDGDVITEIGKGAFEGTLHLDEFVWPSKCLEIPGDCFASSNIKTLKGIENVVSIGHDAFKATTIKSFAWPKRCNVIPERCFANSFIETITGIENVTNVGYSAFASSTIEYIKWPEGCRVIPEYCFADSLLSAIDGIENVTEIGGGAFDTTRCLKEFLWPKGCKFIPERCFYGSAIESIDGIGEVTSIGDSAFAKAPIAHFQWPSGCKIIPSQCFQQSHLKDIEGVENVEEIRVGAFYLSKLEQFQFPRKCLALLPLTFVGTSVKELTLSAPVSMVFMDGIGENVRRIDASACERVVLIEPKNTPPGITESKMRQVRNNFGTLEWKFGFDTTVERDIFDSSRRY